MLRENLQKSKQINKQTNKQKNRNKNRIKNTHLILRHVAEVNTYTRSTYMYTRNTRTYVYVHIRVPTIREQTLFTFYFKLCHRMLLLKVWNIHFSFFWAFIGNMKRIASFLVGHQVYEEITFNFQHEKLFVL